jgi:hypothetical protein
MLSSLHTIGALEQRPLLQESAVQALLSSHWLAAVQSTALPHGPSPLPHPLPLQLVTHAPVVVTRPRLSFQFLC